MLVRCPQCKIEFRLVDYAPDDRVVKYLCPGCHEIVRIDLAQDEVRSSSSPDLYSTIQRRRTVLIADDAESVLRETEDLLSAAGYNVLLAADGVEALRMIRQEHPDLVLLDLLMPKMTGFDVLREIRRDERIRDIPVLAMSGVYRDNVVDFLRQLGAKGFLDKPAIRETLVSRVQDLLPAGTSV